MQTDHRHLATRGFALALWLVASISFAAEEAHPGVVKLQQVTPAFPRDADVQLEGMIDVQKRLADVVVDLKYASTDNFMGVDVYGGLRSCFLVPPAADKLAIAHEWLKKRAPELTFLMWDCARPRRVQRVMWDVVKNTPSRHYVADPNTKTGSIHNYGCAVDISLWDLQKNAPLDMGTPYDHFGKRAEPRHEVRLLQEKQLTSTQVANRLLLREVMLRAGFHVIPNEWWHFNCESNRVARDRFQALP